MRDTLEKKSPDGGGNSSRRRPRSAFSVRVVISWEVRFLQKGVMRMTIFVACLVPNLGSWLLHRLPSGHFDRGL